MRKRYVYLLLFGIPGFFLSLLISFVMTGIGAGFLWLFVFGDDTWPTVIEKILPALLIVVFLGLWGMTLRIGFKIGKSLEVKNNSGVNRFHILISGGLTLTFASLILFQQFQVGNYGPKSDGQVCSDYCLSQAYSGSGMPPKDLGDRTCSCYDDLGNEVLKIRLEDIEIVPK